MKEVKLDGQVEGPEYVMIGELLWVLLDLKGITSLTAKAFISKMLPSVSIIPG